MRAVGLGSANQAAIERLSAVVETNIMLRTTCTATQIEGGHAENALPQRARASLQCRVIPGESPDSVQAALQTVLADPLVTFSTITPATPSPESPLTRLSCARSRTWCTASGPGHPGDVPRRERQPLHASAGYAELRNRRHVR